jgi:hypothetical protein
MLAAQAAAMIERAPDAAAAGIVRAAQNKIRAQDRSAYWIERHKQQDIVGRLRKLIMDALAASNETGK